MAAVPNPSGSEEPPQQQAPPPNGTSSSSHLYAVRTVNSETVVTGLATDREQVAAAVSPTNSDPIFTITPAMSQQRMSPGAFDIPASPPPHYETSLPTVFQQPLAQIQPQRGFRASPANNADLPPSYDELYGIPTAVSPTFVRRVSPYSHPVASQPGNQQHSAYH